MVDPEASIGASVSPETADSPGGNSLSKTSSGFARALAAAGVVAAVGVAGAGSAFAAGAGYGPAGPPSAPTLGGFTAVAASKTITPAGGTIAVTYHGETYDVAVPAGDFTSPTQVTLYAPTNLAGAHAVAGLSVNFTTPANGKTTTPAPLAHPITVTISAGAIAAGDVVEVFNGSAFVTYSGPATVSGGKATVEVTSDPTFAVAAPPTAPATQVPPTVPGATSVHTGKAFGAEELGAGILAAAGAAAVAGGVAARRRRSA